MKTILSLGAIAILSPAALAFDAILTTEHVDVGIGYEGGAWDLHVHDEDNDAEYEPGDALLYVAPSALIARPGGSQWDFTGNNAGDNLWVLPQTQDTSLLFLGIAAEEVDAGVFEGNVVNLHLSAVRGPGAFSLYTTNAGGQPTARMTSGDGISAGDMVTVGVGGHGHYNWAFTSTGMYEVDMFATGLINGQLVQSDVVTYNFGVDAVPEPATMSLLGLGALAMLRRRRKS